MYKISRIQDSSDRSLPISHLLLYLQSAYLGLTRVIQASLISFNKISFKMRISFNTFRPLAIFGFMLISFNKFLKTQKIVWKDGDFGQFLYLYTIKNCQIARFCWHVTSFVLIRVVLGKFFEELSQICWKFIKFWRNTGESNIFQHSVGPKSVERY